MLLWLIPKIFSLGKWWKLLAKEARRSMKDLFCWSCDNIVIKDPLPIGVKWQIGAWSYQLELLLNLWTFGSISG